MSKKHEIIGIFQQLYTEKFECKLIFFTQNFQIFLKKFKQISSSLKMFEPSKNIYVWLMKSWYNIILYN